MSRLGDVGVWGLGANPLIVDFVHVFLFVRDGLGVSGGFLLKPGIERDKVKVGKGGFLFYGESC